MNYFSEEDSLEFKSSLNLNQTSNIIWQSHNSKIKKIHFDLLKKNKYLNMKTLIKNILPLNKSMEEKLRNGRKSYRKISLVDCDIGLCLAIPLLFSCFTGLRLSIDDALPIIFARNFCVCECGLCDVTIDSSFGFSSDRALAPKIRSRIFPCGPSWRLNVSRSVV